MEATIMTGTGTRNWNWSRGRMEMERANSHDSKVFSFILTDLIIALKKICHSDSDIVIVLDKGNNSEKNFKTMAGKISWVGALVPSHYEELINLEFDHYHGTWKGKRFYRCKKRVMGIDCIIVLTFNRATKRKKQHSLKRGIEKLKQDICVLLCGFNDSYESYAMDGTSGRIQNEHKCAQG